jgi:hypothetical protein
MADDTFEEMCCALLAKELDIVSADLFGRPREPQFGIDIIGHIKGSNGTVVVSCKCYVKIGSGELSKWSNDFLDHWSTQWKDRQVRRFILATAADVKSSTRQSEIASEMNRFHKFDVTYEVWPPRLLQEKLRLHPGLVAQFLGREWVQRLCGISGELSADPNELLKESQIHSQACEFEKAVTCAEGAVLICRDVNDKKVLARALRYAARDLGNLVIAKRSDDVEVKKIASRIALHLEELEKLDIAEAESTVRSTCKEAERCSEVCRDCRNEIGGLGNGRRCPHRPASGALAIGNTRRRPRFK